MISLHDYSKCKDVNDSLPTLLNDLNKLVDDEFEIPYIKPKEITIFEVLWLYSLNVIFILIYKLISKIF